MTALARPLFEPGWVVDHLDDIWEHTVEHLILTGLAIGIGFVLSVALSLAVLRWRRLYSPVIGITGTLYTIPSLALFALLVPVWGFSRVTAEVALVSYTLLILVRNIVTGIDGVPTGVREAAVGMGYTRGRLFWEIELPLALPVVMAGVRIATVTVIGLVTVTALLGLGGLGAMILDGLRRSIFFPTEVITGTVASALLAATIDLALLAVQRLLTPWASRTAT